MQNSNTLIKFIFIRVLDVIIDLLPLAFRNQIQIYNLY